MQDYYNIPYMAGGGALATLGKSTLKYITNTYLKSSKNLSSLKGLALSLSKKNTPLSEGINNLVNGKLDTKGIEALQKMAKEHLVKSTAYQTRLKNVQNILRYRKQALDLLKKAENVENKVVGTTKPATGEATETVAEAAARPATLASTFKRMGSWFNQHPALTLGALGLGVGTGPGRYILGKTVQATQSNPATWFSEAPVTDQEYVMINGTKIPVQRSSEGYFVPVQESTNSQSDMPGDAVDQTLAGITNENLGVPSTSQQTIQQQYTEGPNISQQDINDLFDTDQ